MRIRRAIAVLLLLGGIGCGPAAKSSPVAASACDERSIAQAVASQPAEQRSETRASLVARCTPTLEVQKLAQGCEQDAFRQEVAGRDPSTASSLWGIYERACGTTTTR